MNLTTSVGGFGGAAGNGGIVTVYNEASSILTIGNGSRGLFAQSIGGGGGNGNLASAYGSTDGVLNVNVAIGGNGGGGWQRRRCNRRD